VLALVAAVLSGWAWYSSNVSGRLELGRELGRAEGINRQLERLVDNQQDMTDSLAALRGQAEDDRRTLEATLAAATTRSQAALGTLAAQQSADREQVQLELATLAASVEDTRRQMGTVQDDWVLEEIAQLLLLANQRLVLVGDVALASRALALADDRLHSLAGPQLLKVRRALKAEQAALAQLPKVDVDGLALTLAALIKQVGELPLKGDEDRPAWQVPADAAALTAVAESPPDAAGNDNSLSQVGRKVLDDLSDLVRVRRVDQTRVPKLTDAQRFLAYENLRLHLLSAQFVLLRRQPALFKENLRQARQWLAHYFEPVNVTGDYDASLAALQNQPLAVTLPDISGSLALLQAEIQRREIAQ
jgi:uroporphyrin-3 C-methyltransferase|tara:strand:- start:341 stop:1426 length:1086 start_codon:yes stop_codon:yes gene_type:complete